MNRVTRLRAAARTAFWVSIGSLIGSGGAAHAADHFAGKTIQLYVGSPAGGGFDIYARAIAPFWAKAIPGSPNIVVSNMLGGGGARVASFISSVAPKDGTAIAAPSPGAIMGPLLGEGPKVDFDPTKLVYLGAVDNGVRVCVTSAHSKVKTAEDALTHESMMGASAPGGSASDYAFLHNRTSGFKFKIISGYQGMPDVSLAMERGELDGACGWDWSSLKSMRPEWIKNKEAHILFQVGLHADPELTAMGVPQVWDYLKTDRDRKIVELVASQQVFLRFFVAPPNISPEAATILRKAFDRAVASPDFLKEAERERLAVDPVSGEEVQALVEKMYSTPKPIVEGAQIAIKP